MMCGQMMKTMQVVTLTRPRAGVRLLPTVGGFSARNL
jgi:hypothetical protein